MKTNEFSWRHFLNSWLHKKIYKRKCSCCELISWRICRFAATKIDPGWNLNSGFHSDFASYGGMMVRTVANFTVLLPTIVLRDVAFSKAINSDRGYVSSYSSQCSLGKRYICKKHLHRRFLCAAKSVQCHNAKHWGFSLTECNSMKKVRKKICFYIKR